MLRVTLGRAVRRLHRDTAFPRRRFLAYPALETDDWDGNAEHGAEGVLDERRGSHKEASSSGAPTSQRSGLGLDALHIKITSLLNSLYDCPFDKQLSIMQWSAA